MFAQTHTRSSLRFRGWSRKSYAAFYSVGRHITIGNLKTVVADTFLGKQQNIFSLSPGKDEMQTRGEERSPDPPLDELPLFAPVFLTTSTVRMKYKKEYVQYSYCIYTWLMAVIAFSHFYFYHLPKNSRSKNQDKT